MCVIISIGGCIVVIFVSPGGRFPCWGKVLVWVEYFCSVGCCLACVCYGVFQLWLWVPLYFVVVMCRLHSFCVFGGLLFILCIML